MHARLPDLYQLQESLLSSYQQVLSPIVQAARHLDQGQLRFFWDDIPNSNIIYTIKEYISVLTKKKCQLEVLDSSRVGDFVVINSSFDRVSCSFSKLSLGLLYRFISLTPLFLPAVTHLNLKNLPLWLGDGSPYDGAGLSQCTNGSTALLIPDAHYMASFGYARLRQRIDKLRVEPWFGSENKAFWRGALNGPIEVKNGAYRNQRLELVHASILNFGLDAKIVGSIPHSVPQELAVRLASTGMVTKVYTPVEEALRFRVHIDVDGWTNSWDGLFWKLYSGLPVLKIESKQGCKQWYYDQLYSCRNIVFVDKYLNDLNHKVYDALNADRADLIYNKLDLPLLDFRKEISLVIIKVIGYCEDLFGH